MSFETGMAALNLEFTDRVPRTEYSAPWHWELVQAVTGIDTSVEANRGKASRAFVKAWDFAFMWSTPGGHNITVKTDMGHAVYNADGSDKREIGECPFKTVDEVLDFEPSAVFPDEPLETIVERCNKLHAKGSENWEGQLVTGGIYETLFSGLIAMFGWDMLLMAGGTDEERFGRVIDSYAEWIERYYIAWAKSDAPVIMSHDDICWTSGPVFAPDWYRKHIFPKYKRFWGHLIDAGKKVMFTSDGTFDVFFDDIVEAGAHSLVMEPTCNMQAFADKYGKTHGFVGNVDTRILLTGTKDAIRKEVQRCMDIGKQYPGFILAVGNHIPPNTPVENALYYNDVYMELSKR